MPSDVSSRPTVTAWTRPLTSLTPRQQRLAVVAATVLTFALAVRVSQHIGSMYTLSDAEWYLAIARGQVARVIQPFSNRQLGALIARALGHVLHLPVERSFIVEGFGALLVLTLFVFGRIAHTRAPLWLLAASIVIPFWPQAWNGLVLPDLFYAALLAVLLLLLAQQRFLLAACMLFPLMVARESTSLTLVCFLIAAWRPLRWRGRALAVVATAAGAMVVKHLSAAALPNKEHLSPVLYLAGKAPWNFVRALGLLPWSNVYPHLCQQPQWQRPFHFGPVSAVGLCGISPEGPLALLIACLSTFGVLPLLTLAVWRRTRSTAGPASPLLRFCLVYGTISFLLAPALGTNFPRLFGYGWPLPLVALPLLIHRARVTFSSGRSALLLALHVALGAMAFELRMGLAAGLATAFSLAAILLIPSAFSADPEAPAAA